MKMMTIAECLLACGVLSGTGGLRADPVRVSVDLRAVRAEVPRTLYGTGMEDVNHEIYGGLDAQRLYDESFEETEPPKIIPYAPKGHGNIVLGRQWDDLTANGGVFAQDDTTAHFGKRSQMLMPGAGMSGVANRGLNGWGVPCREGRGMLGHFYVRGTVGKLVVSLERQDGRVTYATKAVALPDGDGWRKVEFALVPDRTDPAARFAIRATGGGKVWIDDAYLADEPTNELGRLGCREDIAQAFRTEGLTYLRWGGTMANSNDYLWKHFRHGDRRPYLGHWFTTSSCGFTYRDFVKMSEAMKLPCALSISAREPVEDAVEIANWLKQFTVDICVEIGNEECTGWGPNNDPVTPEGGRAYGARARKLVAAMRQANPRLKFACGAMFMGWKMDVVEAVFREIDGAVEYWDVHVNAAEPDSGKETRQTLRKFLDMRQRISPKSTMKIAVFEENAHIHSMARALAHATNLEAMREFGGEILTSCPANALQPYMQNDNGWDQGQIFFTPDRVWLQPCGWAQQMASAGHRDLLVGSRVEGSTNVTVSATRDRESRSAVLHLVNLEGRPRPVAFSFAGLDGLTPSKVTSLDAPRLTDRNPPDDPERISPRDVTRDFLASPSLRPYSYTVVEFNLPGASSGSDRK